MKPTYVFRPGVGFYRRMKFATGTVDFIMMVTGRMPPREYVDYLVGPYPSIDAAWAAFEHEKRFY